MSDWVVDGEKLGGVDVITVDGGALVFWRRDVHLRRGVLGGGIVHRDTIIGGRAVGAWTEFHKAPQT